MSDELLREACDKGYCKCYVTYCKFCVEEYQQLPDIDENELPF